MKNTLFLALLLGACSGSAHSPADEPTAAPSTAAAAPPLVVSIVLDQFPSHAALRYLPHLDEDGLMRRALSEGSVFERVRLEYASTATAAGHAAIHTGRPPSETGIDANDVWDLEKKGEVGLVSKSEGRVFGREGETAGPEVLLAQTVGDTLRGANPASKVVSLSHKARAAILSAGKDATMVSWYDTSLPGFTTSTSYADALPTWIASFNETRPASSAFGEWSAEDPVLYQGLFGADDAPGEASWYGLGTTFPHEPSKSPKPSKVILASPHGGTYLIDAARAATRHYELGKDEHPDLLCISVSTTDYAAHSFSASSWEYLDVLRKVDRELSAFVRELETELGRPVTVLLTSDHGGPIMPEQKGEGGRYVPSELAARLDAVVDAKLGDGDWVAAYVEPFVYLSAAGKERADEIGPILAEAAQSMKELRLIVDAATARSWIDGDDPLRSAMGKSVAPSRGDFYLSPAPGYFTDPERFPDVGKGANHGTPEDYDREVPVFVLGPQVKVQRVSETLAQERVAPTLSALLGLESVNGADALPVL